MQTVNQYILPSPSLTASYPVEGADTVPASPATSRTFSWSMESDPQLFSNDATFWQDVSAFICSSPQNSFDYRSDDFCTSPTSPNNDSTFKAPENTAESSQPRKRRAQNRASQRAYRDRRDQHVRELESQYEEMAKRNETLAREHEALKGEHEKLVAEREAWRAQTTAQAGKDEAGTGAGAGAGAGADGGDGELSWRAEACLSQMLSAGEGVGIGKGEAGGLVVKVVVCKRCFGGAGGSGGSGNGNVSALVKAKCEG